MEPQNSIPTDGPTAQPPQPQKRAWVTPAFEQVALKDALTGPDSPLANDGIVGSS